MKPGKHSIEGENHGNYNKNYRLDRTYSEHRRDKVIPKNDDYIDSIVIRCGNEISFRKQYR